MDSGIQKRKTSTWVGGVLLLAIAGALAFGGWRIFENQRHSGCAACGRAVDGHSLTIATVDGEEQRFCCPACALSVERQSGSKVRILSLSNHSGGGSVDPAEAFVVVGSTVNHCLLTKPLVGSQKHLSHLDYDRCSPSAMAFADQKAAQAFAVEFGGKVAAGSELSAVMQAR